MDGRICFGNRRKHPVTHIIEIDDRDNPKGKTLCGKEIGSWHHYHVSGSEAHFRNEALPEPTCQKCLKKQRKETELTHC